MFQWIWSKKIQNNQDKQIKKQKRSNKNNSKIKKKTLKENSTVTVGEVLHILNKSMSGEDADLVNEDTIEEIIKNHPEYDASEIAFLIATGGRS